MKCGRYLDKPRRVQQVTADQHGLASSSPRQDCSLQRRCQKLVGRRVLTDFQRKEIRLGQTVYKEGPLRRRHRQIPGQSQDEA